MDATLSLVISIVALASSLGWGWYTWRRGGKDLKVAGDLRAPTVSERKRAVAFASVGEIDLRRHDERTRRLLQFSQHRCRQLGVHIDNRPRVDVVGEVGDLRDFPDTSKEPGVRVDELLNPVQASPPGTPTWQGDAQALTLVRRAPAAGQAPARAGRDRETGRLPLHVVADVRVSVGPDVVTRNSGYRQPVTSGDLHHRGTGAKT